MDTSCFTRSSAEVCRGRFGRYLKERLKIQRIPYDLSIADMIVERMLIPDLFVWLPSEYFTSWSNFPIHRTLRNSRRFDPGQLS